MIAKSAGQASLARLVVLKYRLNTLFGRIGLAISTTETLIITQMEYKIGVYVDSYYDTLPGGSLMVGLF